MHLLQMGTASESVGISVDEISVGRNKNRIQTHSVRRHGILHIPGEHLILPFLAALVHTPTQIPAVMFNGIPLRHAEQVFRHGI